MSTGVIARHSSREGMLLVLLDALGPLAEPRLTGAAPPSRRIVEGETTCRASAFRHRDRRSRAERLTVVRWRSGPVHEFLVEGVLSQLPLMGVLPADLSRQAIGALVAVVTPEPFV